MISSWRFISFCRILPIYFGGILRWIVLAFFCFLFAGFAVNFTAQFTVGIPVHLRWHFMEECTAQFYGIITVTDMDWLMIKFRLTH